MVHKTKSEPIPSETYLSAFSLSPFLWPWRVTVATSPSSFRVAVLHQKSWQQGSELSSLGFLSPARPLRAPPARPRPPACPLPARPRPARVLWASPTLPACVWRAHGWKGSIAHAQSAALGVLERPRLHSRDYEARHSAGSFPEAEAWGAGQGGPGVRGG